VKRIEIDQLVGRIDIDALVKRIEIDQLVGRIDIDALVKQIDMDEVIAGVDVNRIVERVDVDSLVEETELGTIVARSTSGVASQALDSARSQTAALDSRMNHAVNRMLHRSEGELPSGPPRLTGEPAPQSTTSASELERPPSDIEEG